MTATARKIVVVNRDDMLDSPLFRAEVETPEAKRLAMRDAINLVCDERTAFEASQERVIDGVKTVGQSPDIKHVQALKDNDAVARLFCALNVDPRAYIFPQSRGAKSANETSNLKAYKKLREIAETIWSGRSSLENVVKVWSVCAFKSAHDYGRDVLPRNVSELFLNASRITQGSQELFEALDEYRAKHMSTGAPTQTSQMVRTLVALGSAEDVRDGREKHTRIKSDGLVIDALMRRFGVVTPEQPEASDVDQDALVSLDPAQPEPTVDDDMQALSDAIASLDNDSEVPVYTVTDADASHVWSHVYGEQPVTVTAPKRARKRRK